MQLGLHSDEAVEIAHAAGLDVVSNRCVKIEHARFHGGLHLAGFDTGVISSQAHAWLRRSSSGRSDARVRRARSRRSRSPTRRYGDPATPVVYICHALTGDAEAAVWWDTLIGPGKPVDTERFHVICANLLGGCKGTTGPSSINPATGEPLRPRLPAVHASATWPSVHRALLRELGIERLHAAVGGSLGGMQILQWALDHPDEIERAVLVCATRAADRAEHRVLQGRARTRSSTPRRDGRRAHDGPHHLPLRGGDGAQVRPRAARPRAR